MLLRAIAPLSMVQELIINCVGPQRPYVQKEILGRMVHPEERGTLTVRVPSDTLDELVTKTQATPHPIVRVDDCYTCYNDEAVLWLSDHDGHSPYMTDATIDIFFHEAE